MNLREIKKLARQSTSKPYYTVPGDHPDWQTKDWPGQKHYRLHNGWNVRLQKVGTLFAPVPPTTLSILAREVHRDRVGQNPARMPADATVQSIAGDIITLIAKQETQEVVHEARHGCVDWRQACARCGCCCLHHEVDGPRIGRIDIEAVMDEQPYDRLIIGWQFCQCPGMVLP